MPWLDRKGTVTVEKGNVRGKAGCGEERVLYMELQAPGLVAGGQVVGLLGRGRGEACLDKHKRPCYSFCGCTVPGNV